MNERYEEMALAMPANLEGLPRLRGFRLRGIEMTRLETFIDAAFAFAISMLVIAAQQIPDDIVSLLAAFKNVPTFICSIAVLIVTILIFIYPLKAIFGAMWYLLSNGEVGHRFSLHTTEAQARTIFAVYALGLICYFRRDPAPVSAAWQLRKPLRLNARERLMTRGELTGWGIPVTFGIVSLVFSFTLPIEQIAWCGWVYFLMAIALRMHGFWHRRRLRKEEG